MDATVDYTDPIAREEQPTWSRLSVAEKLDQFEKLDSPWISCRQIAGRLGVAARTLHHWVHQKDVLAQNSSWPPGVTRFLESPEGLRFLYQLFTAAHLVFLQKPTTAVSVVSAGFWNLVASTSSSPRPTAPSGPWPRRWSPC